MAGCLLQKNLAALSIPGDSAACQSSHQALALEGVCHGCPLLHHVPTLNTQMKPFGFCHGICKQANVTTLQHLRDMAFALLKLLAAAMLVKAHMMQDASTSTRPANLTSEQQTKLCSKTFQPPCGSPTDKCKRAESHDRVSPSLDIGSAEARVCMHAGEWFSHLMVSNRKMS